MEVEDALTRLGGVATREQLLQVTARAAVDKALLAGLVVADARGRYAAPSTGQALRAAHRLSGAVVMLSAALHHGWAVKTPPPLPQVAVPGNRKVSAECRRGVDLWRLRLDPDDVREGVTTQDRTLIDCTRHLERDEALAVCDSALRDGYSARRLHALARDARGPHVARMREVAGRASALAANPFESVLRSIADEIPGLDVRPQVPIYASEFLGCPDLVDVDLRIAVEADSFEWHGGRAALARDARRYNWLVVHGWLVLRFAWEDVMYDCRYVRGVLHAAVAERTHLTMCAPRPA